MKSSPPRFTPLQLPSVVPVSKTDPESPIATPLMTSTPAVPSYRSHDAVFHRPEGKRRGEWKSNTSGTINCVNTDAQIEMPRKAGLTVVSD